MALQQLINLMGTRHVPRVLVGNKLDLVGAGPAIRQVSTEAGQALADSWGCAFMEVSAKGDVNCDRAFHALLDEIDAQNEPDGTRKHDMQRCWRSLCCCLPRRCCQGGSSDDLEARLSPPSAAQLSVTTDRAIFHCKVTAWSTLVLSVLGLVGALLVGVFLRPSGGGNADAQELLSYVLFGFSLLLWIICMLGLYSLRHSHVELLHVYAVSLGVLLVAQIAVTAVLSASISLVSDHLLPVLLVAVPMFVAQGAGCLAAARLAHHLHDHPSRPGMLEGGAGAGGGNHSAQTTGLIGSPYSSDFQTYHSFE